MIDAIFSGYAGDWLFHSAKTAYNLDYLGRKVSPPEPNVKTIEIPYRDSSLDVTYAMSNFLTFKDRMIEMRFELRDERGDWHSQMGTIMSDLHGKKRRVGFTDDPAVEWFGICYVEALEDHGSTAGLMIKMVAEPFARSTNRTQFQDVVCSGSEVGRTWNRTNDRTFLILNTSAAGMSVRHNKVTYPLKLGTNEIPELVMVPGDNYYAFNGSGTIKVSVAEGRL